MNTTLETYADPTPYLNLNNAQRSSFPHSAAIYIRSTAPVVRAERRIVTYFDRMAVVITEHHDSRRDGDRTVITSWVDDADERNGGHKAGTITRTRVKGNAFRAPESFVVIEDETVVTR